MNETLLKKLAKPMLILAPVIWGSSFVVMKHSLDSFTPFYLLAFRFTAAAVLLGLACWKSWRAMDRNYLKSGLIIGTFLFLAYAFQTFGLDRTTSGKNAFLTAVYCVIVPFLYWLIAGRRPDKWNVLAAFICIAGIGMVALTTKGSGGLAVNLGDMLTLAGGFFFAAHIVAVNKFAEGRDIFLITVLQFAVFAAWSWIGAWSFGSPSPPDCPAARCSPWSIWWSFPPAEPCCSRTSGRSTRLLPRRRCSSVWRRPSACCAPSWWEKRTSTPSWSWALR